MAENTAIEWTDATWTPIRARNRVTGKVGWHCEHASPGCANCYSEGFNEKRLGTGLPFKPGHRGDVEHFLDEAMLLAPLRWRRPRRVFVCSMTDLFGEWVSDEWIDRVFAVMALAPQHTFQVLTKRSARMRAYLSAARAHPVGLEAMDVTMREMVRNPRSDVGRGCILQGDICHLKVWPLPNVWLGVSTEDQRRADERVPDLLATPAAIRFVSAEPLLGPINFEEAWHGENALDSECWGQCGWCEKGFPALHNCQRHDGDWGKGRSGLDWIIVGGESGPNARPMQSEWAQEIRDQCADAGVAYFFKQHGDWIGIDQLRHLNGWTGGPGFGRFDHRRYDQDAECLRIGKKAAGRLLDGVEHNGMPVTPSIAQGERP